ncbi:MAG: hypothetical protein ETSY2_12480 [Candidatus Entotheonella gemina]|uniref:GH29D-like beta-sandwich domain-containing protein n=1 Tax=Candidatus Entotheonella gemina TaxID=1429439 RepID=W4MAJ8_9BACT|nr:MAG: hypothetical protein ETSY2_12480 [Candidatus Entotheonella gemina]
MAMWLRLVKIKGLAEWMKRLTLCGIAACFIGLCVGLSSCSETRSPASDVTLPQVWAQPAGGVFDRQPLSVTLVSTKAATIYYTLDGTPPSETSATYETPLVLSAPDVTLRFFAQDSEGNLSAQGVERYRRFPNAPRIALNTEQPLILGPKQRETIEWVCQQHCGRFRVAVGEGGADQDILVAEGEVVTGQGMQTLIDASQISMPQTRLWVHVTSNEGVHGAASLPLAIDRHPPLVRAWPAGGTYGKHVNVELMADEDATIHYTADGTEPTRDAAIYMEALRLSTDTTLRFLAVDRFGNVSSHGAEDYRIRKQAPTVSVQQFPGFRLDVRATLHFTWRSSQGGRYLLSANGQPLLRGRVERNKAVQSVIQGWSLKTPHSRLQLSVTNDEGHEGYISWHLDTESWERFTKASSLDTDATTAWHDIAASRIVLPVGPLATGHYETRYTSRGIAGQDRYAYIANTRGGLHIVDLDVPETPRPVGKLSMYGEPKALAKYGGYVYLAADASDIQIFDVSRPRAPRPVGQMRLAGRASAIAIAGQRAYVGTHEDGLYIYELSQPRHPGLLAHVPLAMPVMDLAATGTHVYVAGFSHGVAVIDITDAAAPTHLTTLSPDPLGRAVLGVAVHEQRLYVAADNLTVYDIRNAAEPSQLARLGLRSAYGLAAHGGYVYVAGQYQGLQIVDVTVPKPRLVSEVETANRAVRVMIRDHVAFVADVLGGLHLIDVSQPDRPTRICHLPKLGQIVDVWVDDGYAYLANRKGRRGRLLVVDVQPPAEAQVVGAYRNGSLTDVVLDGSLVYTLDAFGGLQVVDVSQPQYPTLLGTQLISGIAQGLALYSSYALAAAGAGDLHVIDVSQPHQPATVAHLDLDGESVDVALWQTYAYVAAGTAGIAVVDVSQPAEPHLIGYIQPHEDKPDTKVVRLAVGDGYLYASNTESQLLVFSLASPQQPQLQQRLTNPHGTLWALALHGHLLYTTTILKHLIVYDVSNPAQTQSLVEVRGGARDLAIVSRHLLMATESYRGRGGGLRVLDIHTLYAPDVESLGLAALRVPQASVQSLKVDAATHALASVTLRPQAWPGAYGRITYEVSNNGGDTWGQVLPGIPYHFSTSGSDLRWRAVLRGTPPLADPALYALQLTYELATAAPVK